MVDFSLRFISSFLDSCYGMWAVFRSMVRESEWGLSGLGLRLGGWGLGRLGVLLLVEMRVRLACAFAGGGYVCTIELISGIFIKLLHHLYGFYSAHQPHS